jgi:hypothetical protein
MSVHYDHPCRTAREHIVVTIARQEDASPADFLDRFDHEREEEERLLAAQDIREQATAESELELRYAWGDR